MKCLRAIERIWEKRTVKNLFPFHAIDHLHFMNNGSARHTNTHTIHNDTHTHTHVRALNNKKRNGTKIISRIVVIQMKTECDSVLFQITYGYTLLYCKYNTVWKASKKKRECFVFLSFLCHCFRLCFRWNAFLLAQKRSF